MFLGLFILSFGSAEARLLMQTQGHTSLSVYLNGVEKTGGLYPGYRAEFLANIDFVQFDRLILTGLVGNTTLISRSDTCLFNLDKIHYTMSPGFRCVFKKWILKGSFNHESVYNISRPESSPGASWQNSIRMGAGSKGAYYLYLADKYKKINNAVMNKWDTQLNIGIFLSGSKSIWVAKNHDYRYEIFSLLRYHLGVFRSWAVFASIDQHAWIKFDRSLEHRVAFTVNLFRRGRDSFFGLFYRYVIYDSYSQDNEDRMGAMGMRVIF